MSRHKYPRGNTAGIRIAKAIYCDLTSTPFKPSEELVQKRTNLSRGEMPVQKRDPRIRPDIFFLTVGG